MTTAKTSQRVANDLKEAMNEAEAAMEATAGETGEKAGELRSRLNAALESAKATCRRLEDQTVAAAKATDQAIRGHPYESIGVAFGLGLLIGVLLARK